jgi:DNA ligase (NAD+)
MKIIPPTHCPSCGSTLHRQNAQLFCLDKTECPAQTGKRLQNFCKVLKIKGFGEATLQKLEFNTLNDFINATVADFTNSGFSEHMAAKLVASIRDRIDSGITFNDFISALSIPLIGDVAARKLLISKMEDISIETCKAAGLGDKASHNLVLWRNQEWPEMKPYWDSVLKSSTKPTIKTQHTNIAVCITGKLDGYSRSEAQTYLESLGVTVKSSVTKQVTHLVCEEENSTSSSVQKAKQLNIPIITIRDLEDILND